MAMSRETVQNNPIQRAITEKLTSYFNPVHLQVLNESQGYSVPKGSETHFRIIIVSDKFENVPLLDRHKMINELIHEELAKGVYSLCVVARTPEQWIEDNKAKRGPRVPPRRR